MVIITTPHNLHYSMIVDAAKAGKAIYVEKPMCLTLEELDNIVEVVSENKVPLIVGGGIRSSQQAKTVVAAGADMVVTGNVTEDANARKTKLGKLVTTIMET